MESAAKGALEIAGEGSSINRIGRYSMKGIKNNTASTRKVNCYFCGMSVNSQDITKHARSTNNNCGKTGHYTKVCKAEKSLQKIEKEESEEEVYSVNLFCLCQGDSELDDAYADEEDFKVQVIINNNLASALADTGAKVSVCSIKQARRWRLLGKTTDTKVKIKPYKSEVIPATGVFRCSVLFGTRSVPVLWYIIKDEYEVALSGVKSKQLGIVKFKSTPDTFMPIKMIKLENKQNMQTILCKYPNNFKGTGKLQDHQVKLHIDSQVKPVAEPPSAYRIT